MPFFAEVSLPKTRITTNNNIPQVSEPVTDPVPDPVPDPPSHNTSQKSPKPKNMDITNKKLSSICTMPISRQIHLSIII